MQLDRFTIKSQEALQAADRLAADAPQHRRSTPEHLLAVLLEQDDGVVAAGPAQARRRRPSAIRARRQRRARRAADAHRRRRRAGDRRASSIAVLRAAEREARELNDEYISTEHLLLALAERTTAKAGEALRAPAPTHDGARCRRSRRSAARTA